VGELSDPLRQQASISGIRSSADVSKFARNDTRPTGVIDRNEQRKQRQQNTTQWRMAWQQSRLNEPYKKFSYTIEIAHDAWNGHSRSLKVTRCYANRRGIYDFLLALNSNFTVIFNRSWDTNHGKRRLGVGADMLWCVSCPGHWNTQP